MVERTPGRRVRDTFTEFFQLEAASGIVLIACVVVALLWANLFPQPYADFWHTPIGISFGSFELKLSLQHWINDGLMAIFFLVVGLEIKRELLVGELSDRQKSALPIAAAIGGMVVPAAIYAVLNIGSPNLRGWGVPMATDIAFSLGILALAGSRVPIALKVFLTALAIVDDLGAVLVIALFYSNNLNFAMLGYAGICFALLMAVNLSRMRAPILYGVFGFALWLCMVQSGIHASISGVIIALAIPARIRLEKPQFLKRLTQEVTLLERDFSRSVDANLTDDEQEHVRVIEKSCRDIQMPVERVKHALHEFQSYFIVPVFALANAGVPLSAPAFQGIGSSVSLGVILGLLVGKPLGIFVACKIAVGTGLGKLHSEVSWRQIFGASVLAGIGFTMSIFIAELAFGQGETLVQAKLAILIASAVAAVAGFGLLRPATRLRAGNRMTTSEES